MDIQLEREQLYGAINIPCAKFRGIVQDINVASKLITFIVALCMAVNCMIFQITTLRMIMLLGRKQSDECSVYHTVTFRCRITTHTSQSC